MQSRYKNPGSYDEFRGWGAQFSPQQGDTGKPHHLFAVVKRNGKEGRKKKGIDNSQFPVLVSTKAQLAWPSLDGQMRRSRGEGGLPQDPHRGPPTPANELDMGCVRFSKDRGGGPRGEASPRCGEGRGGGGTVTHKGSNTPSLTPGCSELPAEDPDQSRGSKCPLSTERRWSAISGDVLSLLLVKTFCLYFLFSANQ